jgi:hypothetical protein
MELDNINDILNLDNLNGNIFPFKLSNDYMKNIKNLYKYFGKEFYIKYNNILFPCILSIEKSFREESNSKDKIYILKYKVDETYNAILPFSIRFDNIDTYVANIHKINNFSGSEMIKFVIHLLKLLKCDKVTISDAATVKCKDEEIGLSFLKLLEKGSTFYERAGFKLKSYEYNDTINIYKILDNILNNIKKIKIKEFIKPYKEFYKLLNTEIDYNKIIIKQFSNNDFITENKKEIIDELFLNIINIIFNLEYKLNIENKLNTENNIYLSKFLLNLIKINDCTTYNNLLNAILAQNIYYIKYNNKIYKFNIAIGKLKILLLYSKLEMNLNEI